MKNNMTLEQALQVLKDEGYYVNKLWHVNDVQAIDPTIDDANAWNILDYVLRSEQVTNIIQREINLTIKY